MNRNNEFCINKSVLGLFAAVLLLFFIVTSAGAADTLAVDIYGPGQRKVNIILLPPKTVPAGSMLALRKRICLFPLRQGLLIWTLKQISLSFLF